LVSLCQFIINLTDCCLTPCKQCVNYIHDEKKVTRRDKVTLGCSYDWTICHKERGKCWIGSENWPCNGPSTTTLNILLHIESGV